MSSADGILFAQVVNDFSKKIRDLGPLGSAEGLDQDVLRFRLQALAKLVPYIRLVERERLRVPVRTEEEYRKFFASDDVNKLIKELIFDKLVLSEIMSLLAERPLSTAEIAEDLGQSPSEVTRHLGTLSRQGFVRYDIDNKRFAIA